ncbi:MAG: tetratricopeptide repeat protein [Chloroflexi bacterium]|nr:tetratricopeptide repeat protein [Chloroflexota bacterium]
MTFSPARELGIALGKEGASTVVSALRRLPLAWSLLGDEEFFRRAANYAVDTPMRWSPAALALLTLDAEEHFDSLNADAGFSLPESLRREAAAALENIGDLMHNFTPTENSLKLAGLVALGLRERVRVDANADDLIREAHTANVPLWNTALSCFFALSPLAKAPILHLIRSVGSHSLQGIGMLSILSNPIPPPDQIDLLSEGIEPLPSNEQIKALHRLGAISSESCGALAARLTESFAPHLADADAPELITRLFHQADLLQLANRPAEAVPLLDRAWQISQQLQADITAQVARSAAENDDRDTALLALAQAASVSLGNGADSEAIVIAKLHTGQLDPSLVNLPPVGGQSTDDDVFTLIAMANASYMANQRARAEDYALQAFSRCSAAPNGAETATGDQPAQLRMLARLLAALGLTSEAIRVAQNLLERDPVDRFALRILVETFLDVKKPADALEHAQVLLTLAPDDIDAQRLLASSYESNWEWAASLEAWQLVLAHADAVQPGDLRHAARAALCCGNAKMAAKLSQRAILLEPSSGGGHVVLGRALQVLGDQENALVHFETATELDPVMADAWLALAEHYRSLGALARSLAAIERAFGLVEAPAQLHLLKGEILLEIGENVPASESLETACKLFIDRELSVAIPDHAPIRRLAAALNRLGKAELSIALLEAARKEAVIDRELDWILADSYRALGQSGNAQCILRQMCKEFPDELEVHLALLELLLEGETGLAEADQILASAQTLAPDSFQLKILQAELLTLQGEGREALAHFRDLLRARQGKSTEWRFRLVTGMARAALDSGQPEVALAALKDHLPATADDPLVIRLQVEAFKASGLVENALDLLGQVPSRCENNADILLWASDQASSLNAFRLALDILEHARAADSASPEIALRTGLAWFRLGDIENGKRSLGRLQSLKGVSSEHFRRAAAAFSEIEDYKNSLSYLERALEGSDGNSRQILSDVLEIQLKTRSHPQALEIVEKLLALAADEPELVVKKASILWAMGKLQSALLALQGALPQHPLNSQLHEQLARILQESGEIPAAYSHACQALDLEPRGGQLIVLCTELARACLDLDKARNLVGEFPDDLEVDAIVLRAELALDNGEEVIASQMLNELVSATSAHPRQLAIQARLATRIGQWANAAELFEIARATLTEFEISNAPSHDQAAARLSLAEAAQDIGDYNAALSLARAAVNPTRQEARAHFMVAKLLVLQAERQHLCRALQVTHHAPGDEVLEEQALELAAAEFEHARRLAHASAGSALALWEARMRWALDGIAPSRNEIKNLAERRDALAAAIAACRRSACSWLPEIVEDLDNQSAFALAQLALYHLKDDPDLGLSLCRPLLEQPIKNPLWFALCAFLAKRAGRLTDAVQWISEALTLWPEEVRWHELAGNLCSQLGMDAHAVRHYEHALALAPDEVSLRLALGREYLSQNAPGNALRVLEPASSTRATPPEVWGALAEAHFACGDFPEALRCIAKWKKISPDSPEPLVLEARIAFQENRFAESLKKSGAALAKSPLLPAARSWQVRSLMALGRHVEALEVIDESIERSTSPIPLTLERADVIAHLEGDAAALEYMEKVAQVHPDSPYVAAAISTLQTRLGNLPEAIQMCRAALRPDSSGLPPGQRAQLHYQLGALLRQAGQLDQALHHLSHAAQLSPGLVEAYLETGDIYRLRREPENALEAYRKAMALAPKDTRAYICAGEIMRENRDYSGAELILKRASQLSPGDSNIRRQLGGIIALNLVHRPQGLD